MCPFDDVIIPVQPGTGFRQPGISFPYRAKYLCNPANTHTHKELSLHWQSSNNRRWPFPWSRMRIGLHLHGFWKESVSLKEDMHTVCFSLLRCDILSRLSIYVMDLPILFRVASLPLGCRMIVYPMRCQWNNPRRFGTNWPTPNPRISLSMRPGNERRLYIVSTSLIGWAHT